MRLNIEKIDALPQGFNLKLRQSDGLSPNSNDRMHAGYGQDLGSLAAVHTHEQVAWKQRFLDKHRAAVLPSPSVLR